MIRVVRHGKRFYQTKCDRCGCEFEYEYTDITSADKVICPDCAAVCSHNYTLNALWGGEIEESTIRGEVTYHYCPICKKPLIRIDSSTSILAQPYKCTNCDRLFSAGELEGIITTAK